MIVQKAKTSLRIGDLPTLSESVYIAEFAASRRAFAGS